MFWCSGLRLVARLLDRRVGDPAREEPTVVRHPETGWALDLETESAARRFLERYCCEPSAFELMPAGGEEARPAA